jgi:multicomponent Na+:H+ antiporter subunit C
VVISTGNLVKKLVGLGVFQTSVFQLYITMGKVAGGRPPILEHLPEHGAETAATHVAESHGPAAEIATEHGGEIVADVEHAADTGEHLAEALAPIDIAADPLMGVIYSNPIPHVLILTAIVVGVATLAVGLALVVRIRESFGSIEEADIDEAEYRLEGDAA